jgi:hypothetical protein
MKPTLGPHTPHYGTFRNAVYLNFSVFPEDAERFKLPTRTKHRLLRGSKRINYYPPFPRRRRPFRPPFPARRICHSHLHPLESLNLAQYGRLASRPPLLSLHNAPQSIATTSPLSSSRHKTKEHQHAQTIRPISPIRPISLRLRHVFTTHRSHNQRLISRNSRRL